MRVSRLLLRLPRWLYWRYLDARYGLDDWQDAYGDDPLGGDWA